jgi:hypothetical protein
MRQNYIKNNVFTEHALTLPLGSLKMVLKGVLVNSDQNHWLKPNSNLNINLEQAIFKMDEVIISNHHKLQS